MSALLPLLDTEGSFATFRDAFGLDDDDGWRLPFFAFLVRISDHTVIVDAGVGAPGGDDPFLPERRGLLPDELAAAGVDPSEVDLVVLTHLHVDHVGWTMHEGRPFFSNARYIAHRDDFDWVTETRGERPYVRDNVAALQATGRLELVDGPAEPLPDLRLIRTGGHTPGHCIVDAGDVTLLGDVVMHAHQLADPELAYVGEEDPAAIAAVRRRLLPGLAESGRVVGCAHLGVGRILREGAGFVWGPVD